MNQMAKKIAEEMDNRMYDWLEEQGIHLERNNLERIIELRDKLAKEDTQIRCESMIVETSINDPFEVKTHGIIFFDRISKPLDREQVEEMILKSYELKESGE